MFPEGSVLGGFFRDADYENTGCTLEQVRDTDLYLASHISTPQNRWLISSP